MMKSVIRSALIAVIAVGVLGVVQSVRAAQTNVPAAQVETKVKEHKGEITAIDLKANTFTIKQKNKKSFTFKLATSTKLTGEGKKAFTPADLKVGDHVLVEYTGEGDNMVATHIGHVSIDKAPKAPESK